jgi:hypothetical protein
MGMTRKFSGDSARASTRFWNLDGCARQFRWVHAAG